MPLELPEGARLAVALTVDFDAQSLWMGSHGRTSGGPLSRGEFDAEVGAPRLLDLFARRGILATWCTPTHTMETFPEVFRRVVDAGHEIAAHGLCHERITDLGPGEERALMDRVIAKHRRIVGTSPAGYRSPEWDFTAETLTILEESGFRWDSSLMGRDFEPYHPRRVTIDAENGNSFGPPSPSIVEFPVSWYLDDFPVFEFVGGPNSGLAAPSVALESWLAQFEYAYAHVPGGVLTLTVHPQTIGRAHLIVMLERLVEQMAGHEGVWFATLGELRELWREDGSR